MITITDLEIDVDAADGYTIRPSKIDDPQRLAPRLREDDKRELAALGRNPRESLEQGLRSYYSLTVEKDGTPLCMFGCNPDPFDPSVGIIWMLGSKDLDKSAYAFLRNSKKCLQFVSEDFKTVRNAVMADNKLHMKWLSWLGAKFGPRLTINNTPFWVFNIYV